MQFSYKPGFIEQYLLTLKLSFRFGPVILVHLCFPAAGAFMIYMLLERGRAPTVYDLALIGVSLLFSPLLYLLIVGIGWFTSRNLSREVVVTLTNDGVSVQNALATTDVKWSNIREIEETRQFFLLYLTKRYAVVIPTRVVAANEMGALRERLVAAGVAESRLLA